jgi:hypothetical protein
MTLNRAMSLVAMAFLWTGSQIPVYLFGESIYETALKALVLYVLDN